jgi:hypothetical protein
MKRILFVLKILMLKDYTKSLKIYSTIYKMIIEWIKWWNNFIEIEKKTNKL